MRTAAAAFLGVCLTVGTVSTSVDPPIDLETQARGARKVVLATVVDVQSAFGENDFGDRLILSQVTLRADETLKGPHEATVVVTLEGGSVGGVTLDVSDMPQMERGQRAVLFLTGSAAGGLVPYSRGRGVMTLDADDRVTGTDLTVDDIRAVVKAAQAGDNR
jgi:hypothetical protein